MEKLVWIDPACAILQWPEQEVPGRFPLGDGHGLPESHMTPWCSTRGSAVTAMSCGGRWADYLATGSCAVALGATCVWAE